MEEEEARVDCLLLMRRLVSDPFTTLVDECFRRRRAEWRTLAIHFADARAHLRWCVMARLISSLGSAASPSSGEGVFSASRSRVFRRFLRHSTTPTMRKMRAKARDRERPRMTPVRPSSVDVLPQPLGSAGMVDDVAAVDVDTDSSSTGSSVGVDVDVSTHCAICRTSREGRRAEGERGDVPRRKKTRRAPKNPPSSTCRLLPTARTCPRSRCGGRVACGRWRRDRWSLRRGRVCRRTMRRDRRRGPSTRRAAPGRTRAGRSGWEGRRGVGRESRAGSQAGGRVRCRRRSRGAGRRRGPRRRRRGGAPGAQRTGRERGRGRQGWQGGGGAAWVVGGGGGRRWRGAWAGGGAGADLRAAWDEAWHGLAGRDSGRGLPRDEGQAGGVELGGADGRRRKRLVLIDSDTGWNWRVAQWSHSEGRLGWARSCLCHCYLSVKYRPIIRIHPLYEGRPAIYSLQSPLKQPPSPSPSLLLPPARSLVQRPPPLPPPRPPQHVLAPPLVHQLVRPPLHLHHHPPHLPPRPVLARLVRVPIISVPKISLARAPTSLI